MSLFSSTELNAFDSFLADLVATDQSVLYPVSSLTGTTSCSTDTTTTISTGHIDGPPDHYVLSSPNVAIWADRQYPWTYRTRPDLADRSSLTEKSKSSAIPYETFRSYTSSDFDCAPRLPEYTHSLDVTRCTTSAGADRTPARLESNGPEGLEANLANLSTPATFLISSPPVPPPPLIESFVESASSSSYRRISAHTPAHTSAHASPLDGRQAFLPHGSPYHQRTPRISTGRPDDTHSLETISTQPNLGPSHASSYSSSSSSSPLSSGSSSNRQTPCLETASKLEGIAVHRQSSALPGLLTATQKRANHIHSEKKRRETIKKRTEALCEIVPSLKALCFIKEEQEEEAAGVAAAAKEGPRDNKDKDMGKKRKKTQKAVGRRGRRSEEDRERLSFKIGGPKSEKIILIKTIEHLRTLQANRCGLLTRLDQLHQQGLARGLSTDVLGANRPSEWDSPWRMTEREDREDGEEESV